MSTLSLRRTNLSKRWSLSCHQAETIIPVALLLQNCSTFLGSSEAYVFPNMELTFVVKANPTGVIGLCNALICGVRRRDGLYDGELRPLRDLCSDRQAQCSLWFPWTSTVRLEGRGMYFPFTARYIFHRQDSRAFSHELMEYKDWRDI